MKTNNDDSAAAREAAARDAGRADAVPDVKTLAKRLLDTSTNNLDADGNLLTLSDVLSWAFGQDTIGPAREWMEEAVFEALEAAPQQMTTQGEAVAMLERALEDAHRHGLQSAPFALKDCVRKVAAAFASKPTGSQP